MPLKAEAIDWKGQGQDEEQRREFRERGDQHYSLEILPIGITMDVDRLRRQSGELIGELSVSVGPKFREAKAYNGVISVGDLNLSSVQARTTRAKLLAERSGAGHLDWHGFLEELCIRTTQAERQGKPAVVLADMDLVAERVEHWEVDGIPILKDLPMVLYGDSGGGKSYLALYVAGMLAQMDVNVLYADWEFSLQEHRKRLGELFHPMPRNVFYARCDSPASQQVDRLDRLKREHKCHYIVCDSIGFALDGPAESQEGATKYFRSLRQLNIGSLSLAHIPKQYDDGREAQIFGSTFFRAGARSAWFVEKATTNPRGEMRVGLHHRKSNVGALLQPKGYRILFEHGRVRLEKINIKEVDELTLQLPLLERMKMQLANGALTLKQLSEDLAVPPASVRSILSRHKSAFVKMGNKYGLIAEGVDF